MPRKKRKLRKKTKFDNDNASSDDNNNEDQLNNNETGEVDSTEKLTRNVSNIAQNPQEEKLKSLILKRIIKENHQGVIKQISFNRVAENAQNLLASISDKQVCFSFFLFIHF